MSEKVRALNLTTGNALTSPAAGTTITGAAAGTVVVTPSTAVSASVIGTGVSSGGCALIGAPTLISSTFSGSSTQALTPTSLVQSAGAGGGDIGVVGVVGGSSISDTESQTDYAAGHPLAGQLNFHLLPSADAGGSGGASGGVAASSATQLLSDANSIMNSSQISQTSNDSMQMSMSGAANGSSNVPVALKSGGNSSKHLAAQSVAGKSCRFPKLEECAHFHYERVQLGPLSVRLVDDKSELLNSSIASQSIGGDIGEQTSGLYNATAGGGGPASFRSFSPSSCWFIIKVFPHRCDAFLIKRSFDNMQMLDEMLHRCVYDRKISGLKNLQDLDYKSEEDVEYAVAKYLERFSKIASDSLTCGTILTWLQLDNKGRRLPLADTDTMRSINTPAVGAAYGVRRYQAQASDEISIEVGDMISVIDMPSPAESIWWRGKKSHMQKSHYEVGFFPQACVATIGDKVPRNCPMPPPLVGQLDVSPTKPVLRKHGKLIAFFRSFILSRPSRRRLKQSGIYRERVFSCDLSEHLLNSGQEIPMVLKCCAEFIEDYGIIDGIYRLSGITSNIQKLRRAFDEERIPDLGNPEMKQDIHAVSSLLKMYFRELPNPLCTYQLYDNFVEAIQEKSESNERLRLMKETVLKLPPPHYRTLKYLSEHLNKISQHSARTGMTDKNLAIVWAPNLLRSPALESGGVAALRGVGVQAVVTEYLIRNCHKIFDALDDPNARLSYIATAGATSAGSGAVGGGGGVGAGAGAVGFDSLTDCESLLVEQREHDQSLVTFSERPKSLGAGGPKLISLEEAQERHSRLDTFDIKQSMPISMTASNAANIGSYIEVGGGPSSLPDKYHTVLSVPRNWQKRKTHSWKSLFTRNQRSSAAGGGGGGGGAGGALAHKPGTGNLADNAGLPPHHRKEAAQVTFADADAIINSSSKMHMGKSLLKQEKTKSIELFDTSRGIEVGKPMEVCVRSNSIDSLRTAGHSRSVSHDSYFDLLQSPQRGHMTTCPSRELSELGLNFDREEPEMRIFSESESLVSSPRVGKENIPPAAATRRILRARPEEFSSQTNSVNPSPKKQPRLNLLLSPSSAGGVVAGAAHTWPQQGGNPVTAILGDVQEHVHLFSDESCCKRYKLEDQLSDIQYIDCSTPEHQIANPQTLYTSVQVHAPPKSALSKSSLYSSTESTAKLQDMCAAKVDKKFLPTGKASKDSIVSTSSSSTSAQLNTRYSYPTVQLGAKRKDQDKNSNFKERFSYPGTSINGNERRYTTKEQNTIPMEADNRLAGLPYHKKSVDELHSVAPNRAVTFNAAQTHKFGQLPQHLPKVLPADLLRAKNRSSYVAPNEPMNVLLLRSSSIELTRDAKPEVAERTKLSITPSSPVQSPRYSLLVGDTSSENSSAVNTPQYDLDPLMVASAMSGLSGLSGNTSSNQQQPLLLGVDAASSYLGTSRESLGSNFTTHSHMTGSMEQRDMHALKRELSLDLQPLNSAGSHRMAIDQLEAGQHATLPAKLQLQQQLPSPNNSNFTDNTTSQSVTPSEFGYQHLQRQSSMHSLIETEGNSPAYEEYENTPSNLVSPMKLNSPIKSTISITYNLKSPSRLAREGDEHVKPKALLETSFDEHTVYEQVKFFRNSVTEVNQMLNDGRKGVAAEQLHTLEETSEKEMSDLSQPKLTVEPKIQRVKGPMRKGRPKTPPKANSPILVFSEPVQEDAEMQETQLDSLEEQEKLLYQNVELRKPQSVYENLLGEQMKHTVVELPAEAVCPEIPEKFELDSLDSIQAAAGTKDEPTPTTEMGLVPKQIGELPEHSNAARRSPSNFSVKELANKFESSPVEQATPFDFSVRSSMRSKPLVTQTATQSNLTHAQEQQKQPQAGMTQNPQAVEHKISGASSNSLKQKLTKTQQITRSLDENAFVREFGAKHLHDLAARSIQQLPELAETASSGGNRRKSFDFTRPKTLNPPKRLPGMPITEETCLKTEQTPLAFKLGTAHNVERNSMNAGNSSLEHDYASEELKITPTTENRISLIQNNVTLPPCNNSNNMGANSADLSNSNLNLNLSSNNLKMLCGVKLDRERIDKIKEERRQQLTQKYRNETAFKSKSKTDLHTSGKEEEEAAEKFSPHGDSLRIKSKSRGDMRSLQRDMDNMKEFGHTASAVGGSESTLHTPTVAATGTATTTTHRVRSISDEKNQNCETNNTHATTTITTTINNSNLNSNLPTTTLAASPESTAKLSTAQEEFSARATAQKFERKCLDYANGGVSAARERRQQEGNIGNSSLLSGSRTSLTSTREKISPQFSIRDVTAMFESRSQNQQ